MTEEEKSNNKIRNNSHYIKWGITAFAVIACAILFYFGLDYFAALLDALGDLMRILSPFILGMIIAYLLLPITSFYERKLCRPLTKKLYKNNPKKTGRKMARSLAVLLAEITMVLIVAALLYQIIPQLYSTISEIIANAPEYLQSAYKGAERLLRNNPAIEQYANKIFGNINENLLDWAQNTVLPSMENVIANITNGLVYAIRAVYVIVVGIIVSIYVLFNRENWSAYWRKILYSIVKVNTAKEIIKAVEFTDDTFMGFIKGKLLASAIIGVICYFGCLILRIPYAPLIAVIIGVFNIIPFFGPYIGAIPCVLLVLLVDPVKCLVFIAFVVVLKMFETNILSPKILGETVGINGFWVIFAIILGAGLFGFWGMLLGVPVFVIIYNMIGGLVDMGLKKKDIPSDIKNFKKLDYIDPETGEFIKHKQKVLEEMCVEPLEEEAEKTEEKPKEEKKEK